ncbi:MAG: hypothetical protein F6J93_32610 [Oscillatoria sp. SIO1A7]|nr:hypothetical protein [Oscillatoria sp. SIO1A7]
MSTFKTHVALNVSDIKKSVDFYKAMLGQSPIKYKADYAKFDLDNPALNLSLLPSHSMIEYLICKYG